MGYPTDEDFRRAHEEPRPMPTRSVRSYRPSKAVKKLLDRMVDDLCEMIHKDIIRDQYVKPQYKKVKRRRRWLRR